MVKQHELISSPLSLILTPPHSLLISDIPNLLQNVTMGASNITEGGGADVRREKTFFTVSGRLLNTLQPKRALKPVNLASSS